MSWAEDERARLTARADPETTELLRRQNEPPQLTLLREQLIRGSDISRVKPPAPLVDGLFDLDSLAALYGKPGSAKTFVALDVACTVAAGTRWHDRTVDQGAVIYVAGEGLGGLGLRVRAWQERYPQADISPLLWLPRPVNLLDSTWASALTALVAETAPKLVVIDTLARAMVGGEENSAKDMGRVVDAADHLRRAAGSCILLVHHLGKDAANGLRGSNSLEAGVDVTWEATRESEWVTLNCQRQKNHAVDPEPLKFALANIAESCVLVDDTRRAVDTMHESIKTTLQALDDVETPGGTSTSVWRMSSGINERTFYRHVKKLIEFNLIINVGTVPQPKYRLTDEGRSCLTTATTAT